MNASDVLPLDRAYFELDEWMAEEQLLASLHECIAAQREAAGPALAKYSPNSGARKLVSPEALRELLDKGEDVHGLATDRDISNAISFNAKLVHDAVVSGTVQKARAAVDRIVQRLFRETFNLARPVTVTYSGQFWYPPGGFMSWHTNNRFPGWRIYISHAEKPNKSFFRYRDPASGEIVTVPDTGWNVRMFRVDPRRPLWHCVYSDTNRYSFGFVALPQSRWGAMKAKLGKLFGG